MRTRGRGRVAAVLGALALVVAGCTGVPQSSTPMVIRTIPIGGLGNAARPITPGPGISPRNLVEQFLQANVLDASAHSSARAFLSPAARNSWSDATVTVVEATPSVSLPEPASNRVVVQGRVLGSVDSSGIYTPTLQATTNKFVFGISQVRGQYRINSLHPGLLLTEADFLANYTQRSVYYYDLAHRYLVPDPRWTSLTDPPQLEDWLLARMTGDPSDELQNAVSNDTLPAQANARRINADVGSPTKIEIPGSSLLNRTGRNRLAAQVGATLSDAAQSGELEITDNGKPVTIPSVGAAKFGASAFAATTTLPAPRPDVYFLRGGRLVSEAGKRLKGAVNNDDFYLQSVAVSRPDDPDTLSVAAVAGTGSAARLLVGTQNGGLRPTPVRGQLTRPAFAPGRNQVWVGSGQKIFQVTVDNADKTQQALRVSLPPPAAGGRVVALRLSPDGSRVAIVFRGANGAQQLYVGAIVRGPGQVRVDTLSQVTPEGVSITDLAWAEPLKLLAIGTNTSTGEGHTYRVGADGSNFVVQGIEGLPHTPTSVTIASGAPAWVTSSDSVWTQQGPSSFTNAGPTDPTNGYNPTYLE